MIERCPVAERGAGRTAARAIIGWAAACAAAMLAQPVLAQAKSAEPDPQAIFSSAHALLGGGVRFTPQSCAAANPLLDRAIAASSTPPLETFAVVRSFAQLERGYCRLAEGQDADAVRQFEAVAANAATFPEGQINLIGSARACLAHAYATGRGVKADGARALGFFVLADGYRCQPLPYDVAREAADTVLSQDRFAAAKPDSMVYHFLEQGSAKDLLRAVSLYETQIAASSGLTPRLFALAMAGVRAGGATDEDIAARAELNRKLGGWHLKQGRRAVGYAFLLAADSAAARRDLAAVEKSAAFELTLADGTDWTPDHAH